MSCSSMRHRFDEAKAKGLDFGTAMTIYHDVEGAVSSHKVELQELQIQKGDPAEIDHLREHISEGETLLQEIRGMRWPQ